MKSIFPVMSLRILILLLVSLLTLVALALSANNLRQGREAHQFALLIAERNDVADNCLRAANYFAFERGRSNMLLNGQNLIDEESQRFIEINRSAADTEIGRLLARLPDSSRATGEEVRRAWEVVKNLRHALDHDFSLSRAKRNPALPKQWLVAANDLVARLENLMIDVSKAPGRSDTRFERLSNLRILVLQFRNLVGTESNMLAAELASGRRTSRDVFGAVNFLRGRSMQVWSQIEIGMTSLADTESSTVIDSMQAELHDRLRPLQDEIIRETGSDNLHRISVEEYLATSFSALNSIVKAADSISQAVTGYTNNRLERARRQEMIALASIAAILLLVGLVATLLTLRFTRPLNGILRKIDKLIGIQSGEMFSSRFLDGRDEFSRIRQALGLLDASTEARLRSDEALNKNKRINASILASIPQSVIATGIDGLITVFSPGSEKMLGYSAEEMVGKQTPMLFLNHKEVHAHAEALSKELGVVVEPSFEMLMTKSVRSAQADKGEWTYIRKDGTRLTVLLEVTPLRNTHGGIDGCLGVATDITERTQITAEISHLAYHDPLTRLPNRRLFHDRMQMAITQARRNNARLALMLIDLDRFKPVNDNFGHAVGDLLLKAVATRMRECLRESDTLARIGGDEFIVVAPSINTESDALGIAEKIRLALNKPFELAGGYNVSIACSIGIAIYPDHGSDEKFLSNNADIAMYTAKQLGRNRVQVFGGIPSIGTKDESDVRSLSIVRLVWRRIFNCGEASIDQEHQDLFDRANKLIHAFMIGEQTPEKLPVGLDDLIDSVAKHFANEEAILAQHHYADLENHALQHKELIARAHDLRRMALAGGLTLGDLVTLIAQKIVAEHILTEDRKYYPILNEALKHASSHSAEASNEHHRQ